MRRLKVASPSDFNLHSRPSDPTFLLRDHETIIDYAILNYCESPALIDVVDRITLAIEGNSFISGIYDLTRKGQTKIM